MSQDIGLLCGIEHALRYATQSRKWVVIVVPPGEVAGRARRIFAAVLPQDAPFGGRTAIVGKGKVSIVSSDSPVFLPDNTDFSVIFLGWGDKASQNANLMELWRKEAAEVLTLGIS